MSVEPLTRIELGKSGKADHKRALWIHGRTQLCGNEGCGTGRLTSELGREAPRDKAAAYNPACS